MNRDWQGAVFDASHEKVELIPPSGLMVILDCSGMRNDSNAWRAILGLGGKAKVVCYGPTLPETLCKLSKTIERWAVRRGDKQLMAMAKGEETDAEPPILA